MDQPIKSLFPLHGSFGSNEDDLHGAPLGVDGAPIKLKDTVEGFPLKQIHLDRVPLSGDVIDGMPSKFVSNDLRAVTSNRHELGHWSASK